MRSQPISLVATAGLMLFLTTSNPCLWTMGLGCAENRTHQSPNAGCEHHMQSQLTVCISEARVQGIETASSALSGLDDPSGVSPIGAAAATAHDRSPPGRATRDVRHPARPSHPLFLLNTAFLI